MKPPKMVTMNLKPVWESLTQRARAGRLNEAHLQNALLDDLAHQRLTRTETLRLPPTLEWVFRFPEEFAVIKMAHAAYLRRQYETGRFQLVVRQRLIASPKLVNLFPEDERLPLLESLLSQGAAVPNWPTIMMRAGFPHEVIASLIKGRIVDRDSAGAFLWFLDEAVWCFFHGGAFREVITLCAKFAPDIVLNRRAAIETHMIEFDPVTCTYRAPLPEARAIMSSILLRELTVLFKKIESDIKQHTFLTTNRGAT